ncbi:AAA family ATPase [Arsukibacterium sp.]|uniref:AAA family ATPase n=1 Tax=Arsukibacterium sp. TaxID=1977258 RepID=UPI002FDA6868
MHEFDDLRVLVQARSPLIIIESYEELRALALIKRLAVNLFRPVFQWTITDGLLRLDKESSAQAFNTEPDKLLAQIKGTRSPGIYVLCDFHPFLAEPRNVRFLKEIAQAHDQLGHTIILLSYAINLPPELARLSYRFQLHLPSDQQIRQLIHEMAEHYTRQHNMLVDMAPAEVANLVKNLRGLTFEEVKRLSYKAIANDGAITAADLPRINKAKFNLLQTDGVLAQVYDSKTLDQVIGLPHLKRWLSHRQPAFVKGGKDMPKGILLTGVQGTGKSLAAKAIAGSWALPLLRLDMAALYNKYIGETEKNLLQALNLADAMSPCVLWIDEIEKGMASSDNDNGVSRRLLGIFLTWMSERKGQVFMVATANNITELAPELLRKGRFDEIFFVDLPGDEECLALLALHLSLRDIKLDTPALAPCLALCQGFSGAELEQAVVGACYRATADEVAFSLDYLLAELAETQPLSVVMAEQLQALRQWASQRCVRA